MSCGQDGGVGTGDPGGIGGYEDVEEGDSYKKEESVQTSLRGKKALRMGWGLYGSQEEFMGCKGIEALEG